MGARGRSPPAMPLLASRCVYVACASRRLLAASIGTKSTGHEPPIRGKSRRSGWYRRALGTVGQRLEPAPKLGHFVFAEVAQRPRQTRAVDDAPVAQDVLHGRVAGRVR